MIKITRPILLTDHTVDNIICVNNKYVLYLHHPTGGPYINCYIVNSDRVYSQERKYSCVAAKSFKLLLEDGIITNEEYLQLLLIK